MQIHQFRSKSLPVNRGATPLTGGLIVTLSATIPSLQCKHKGICQRYPWRSRCGGGMRAVRLIFFGKIGLKQGHFDRTTVHAYYAFEVNRSK